MEYLTQEEYNAREVETGRIALIEYEKNLDYRRLAVIKNKPISQLTEEDLEFLGVLKYPNKSNEYYCRSILSGMFKIYLDRLPDGTFNKWHYRPLGVDVHIETSSQLLYEVITKWRLQLHKQNP